MEPALCGCAEVYLNFGCFIDADGLSAHQSELLSLHQANQTIYPAVYAHLRAARDLEACARRSVQSADPEGLYRLTRSFFSALSPARSNEGSTRDVFLRAWTPEGLTDHSASAAAVCRTCVALRDPCGLSAPLLERLSRHCTRAGYDSIRILSPIDPGRAEALLVPEAQLAFLAAGSEQSNCAATVDVDCFFPPSEETRTLLDRAHAHCEEASALLSKARALHSELEALCRPFVAFEGVDLLTEEYRKQLRSELLRK